jgi:predicted KAP-like P-loop ATPase
MWHDNETSVDLLGFERFADVICSLPTQENLLPLTIGLYGDWGSGKSSVLGMIEKKYSSNSNALCLRFDGWLFEGYDDAKAALMTDVIEAINKKTESNAPLLEKIKIKSTKLLKRVDWFRLAGLATKGIISLTSPLGAVPEILNAAKQATENPTEAMEEVKSIIRPEVRETYENIRHFRREFEELIAESGLNPVVILIDDLDRCLPESIISTLEAIKLFLSVKGTVFVLAADERIIRHSISQRYPMDKNDDQDITQEYLDKLIQIPVKLPFLSEQDVASYMYMLFAENQLDNEKFGVLCSRLQENRKKTDIPEVMNYGIANDALQGGAVALQQDFTIVESIAPILSKGLNGNPRLVKRFLNTLSLRIKMAKALSLNIKANVLCKIMILERFHEDRFNELFRWQSEQDGKPSQIAKLMKAIKNDDDTGLNSEEKVWLIDPDIKNWIETEPSLETESLKLYFHIARETIRISTIAGKQLPQHLQTLFASIQSKSDTLRASAVKTLTVSSPEDAGAIYDSLISKSLRANGENALMGLIGLAQCREEIGKRLIASVKMADPASLNPKALFGIASIKNNHPTLEGEVNELLKNWQKSPDNKVKRIAEQALKPIPTQGARKGIHGG